MRLVDDPLRRSGYQSPAGLAPEAADWYAGDVGLRRHLARLLGPSLAEHADLLHEWGALAAGPIDRLASIANDHPPELRTHDRNGQRIDKVDYHPSYLDMAALAYGHGLVAHAYGAGGRGRLPRPVTFACEYLFGQAEAGLFCPVAMTDGVAVVLRKHDPALWQQFGPALTATEFGLLAQGAMFMTERQGGSDVGATRTIARREGDGWALHGEKWFCSNAGAELTLTLARPEGAPGGTRGLGLFLLPSKLSDGSPNAMAIHRLKDKLGTRSMATGEVGLYGAQAYQVGALDRGFVQMTEMVNLCRLSNAVGSLAIARRALVEANQHARAREAFGRPIITHPLLAATLGQLGVEHEGHLSALFEAVACYELLDTGLATADDRALFRWLVPVLKYTTARYSVRAAAEAIEVLGGNGCVEEFVTSRLYRDAQILVVWEGTTNILVLDALRTMAKDEGHRVLFARTRQALAAQASGPHTGLIDRLQREVQELEGQGDRLILVDAEQRDPGFARWIVRTLGVFEATLLLTQLGDTAAAPIALRFIHDLFAAPMEGPQVFEVQEALG